MQGHMSPVIFAIKHKMRTYHNITERLSHEQGSMIVPEKLLITQPQDLHKEINLEVDGKQIELPPIEGRFLLFEDIFTISRLHLLM